MNRVAVKPELITWARERAGLDARDLLGRFPKLLDWESGERMPTMRQLEGFVRAVHVPIGFVFLPEPPRERLPVPDFRTVLPRRDARPSPNLLDTLYLCQQRQDWFRNYALMHGLEPLGFVGSASQEDDPVDVAQAMQAALGHSLAQRQQLSNWTEALRLIVRQAENAGVLVMASSIVGSNSHRNLDVSEFRGFALADDLAPLLFINAGDSKAAQMFTLAHEMAHLWLGASGVSDTDVGLLAPPGIERWCNEVAAEFLMPLEQVRRSYAPGTPVPTEIQRLARSFKVSTLVALRRLFDAGILDRQTLWTFYREELDRIRVLDRGGASGGDFYRTLGARTGKRFARAVLESTLEGQTLFQDAFRMLGMRKTSTLYAAAREMGVIP